jgi:hypothetical protein
MNAIAAKVGNYLCYALSFGGCEYSNTVNVLGYGAIIVPLTIVAFAVLHLNHE